VFPGTVVLCKASEIFNDCVILHSNDLELQTAKKKRILKTIFGIIKFIFMFVQIYSGSVAVFVLLLLSMVPGVVIDFLSEAQDKYGRIQACCHACCIDAAGKQVAQASSVAMNTVSSNQV
jgi:hypothetical protein